MRLLSNTLNIVETRSAVQGSDTSLSCFTSSSICHLDVFRKRGIELKGVLSFEDFSDECTARKNKNEFLEHVKEVLGLMASVLEEKCNQALAILLMFPSSIMWQISHERFYLQGEADAKYSWNANQ